MSKGNQNSNDQRSNVHNPNNHEHKDAVDNRSNQLNPNNHAYHDSRGGNSNHHSGSRSGGGKK